MPIYEYECAKCKGRFEYMQKMSEKSKTKCETCGGKLSRLISPAGFHLKGGGWYKDGYASKGSGSSSGSGAGSGSSSKSESSGGGEKKSSEPSKKDSKE